MSACFHHLSLHSHTSEDYAVRRPYFSGDVRFCILLSQCQFLMIFCYIQFMFTFYKSIIIQLKIIIQGCLGNVTCVQKEIALCRKPVVRLHRPCLGPLGMMR